MVLLNGFDENVACVYVAGIFQFGCYCAASKQYTTGRHRTDAYCGCSNTYTYTKTNANHQADANAAADA